jgi:hypothetical protein
MRYSSSGRFYIRSCPRGFGYQILDKGEPKQTPFKLLFHSSSKEQVQKVFETIEENHVDFPEPETEWEPQRLSIEEKHYTSHFLVRSPEELDKVAFAYMMKLYKSQYNPFVKWEYSKCDQWIDPEVIEKCENERFKKEMTQSNELFKKSRKEIDLHNRDVDRVIEILEGNIVHHAYQMLRECEFLFYSLELETFSNEYVEV